MLWQVRECVKAAIIQKIECRACNGRHCQTLISCQLQVGLRSTCQPLRTTDGLFLRAASPDVCEEAVGLVQVHGTKPVQVRNADLQAHMNFESKETGVRAVSTGEGLSRGESTCTDKLTAGARPSPAVQWTYTLQDDDKGFAFQQPLSTAALQGCAARHRHCHRSVWIMRSRVRDTLFAGCQGLGHHPYS